MFWDNYVSLCTEKGLSPNAVASELGLSSGSVTAWKNKTIPRDSTLRKIADYFEVSVDFLIGREKKENPAPESAEFIPGYEDLSEENKAKARDFIAFLLSQQ